MKQTRIKVNLDGLDELKRLLTNTYVTRVGILGDHAQRKEGGPMNNAEIGLLQQFGSISDNIPPRDFLIMPIERNKRDITKSMAGPTARAALQRGDIKRLFELLGTKAQDFIQQAFETGGFGQWAPNAPATIARKGSDKPLVDTSQLRRAITSEVAKKQGNQSITAGGAS